MQVKVRPETRLTQRRVQHFSKRTLLRAVRTLGPTLVALTFAGVSHVQGNDGLLWSTNPHGNVQYKR
jgi:hypothetical protein